MKEAAEGGGRPPHDDESDDYQFNGDDEISSILTEGVNLSLQLRSMGEAAHDACEEFHEKVLRKRKQWERHQ